MQTSAQRVVAALRSKRFRYDNEAELQAGIAIVLDELGLPYAREHRLGRSRDQIDFMVEGVLGIEVKVDGSLTALTRQAHRYLQHDELAAMLVVTTKSKHRNLPDEVSGKSVEVVWISGGAF